MEMETSQDSGHKLVLKVYGHAPEPKFQDPSGHHRADLLFYAHHFLWSTKKVWNRLQSDLAFPAYIEDSFLSHSILTREPS